MHHMSTNRLDGNGNASKTCQITRRGFLLSAPLAAAIAVGQLQSGCAATIKDLFGRKDETANQKPEKNFAPGSELKQVPVPPQAPKEPSAAERIAQTMEQARKAENEGDELFVYASKRIDSMDFKKMGELSRSINAELEKFRTDPTEVQQAALAVSYAEYEKYALNLIKAFQLLDMAASSYGFATEVYQILLSKNLPQVEPYLKQISKTMQRLDTKRGRVMQSVRRTEDEFVAAQVVVDIPPWSEIEKIQVRDETQGIWMPPPADLMIPPPAGDDVPYTDDDLFPPQNKE